MEAKLYKFPITDFEEIYTVIDTENQRLHISPVNYSFNLTLDLTRDLKGEILKNTKHLEKNFSARVQEVIGEIISDLNLNKAKITDFKVNDKVSISYDYGIPFEGFIHSIDDKHITIHEYVPDIYRTLLIENIVEIEKI